jgi:hypothetical protein
MKGVNGVKTPKKALFMNRENERKIGAEKVFPGKKFRPGSGSRIKHLTKRKSWRDAGQTQRKNLQVIKRIQNQRVQGVWY